MAEATTATPNASSPKVKTKAKKRYLKRKQERRKSKKKQSTNARSTAADEDDKSEAGEEELEDEVEPERYVVEDSKLKERGSERRPKKRRKISVEPETEQPAVEPLSADILPPRKSPTPPTSLPVFPLPALPNAPSKSELALQGLDKALVDAELVDASATVTISAQDDDGLGIGPRTRKRLLEMGIAELFAVQKHLIPFLLPHDKFRRALYMPYDPPRDVCVSAPTGSGKTLAYVVPIVELLSSRTVTRLRALIVLPTRDLVTQVRETFEAIGRGRGLKIATATGQHSFSHEQAQLIADQKSNLQGGSSRVDILICTPGRLIDHLNETQNFSLQHLRFLVIDEADRLLAQSFQNWLVRVLAATRAPPKGAELSATTVESPENRLPVPDATAPAFGQDSTVGPLTYVPEDPQTSCQKLLLSATLTRDPEKIAALSLKDPKYFVVQDSSKRKDNAQPGVMDVVMEKFSVPASLVEHMVICESSQKPLYFFHLVHSHNVTNALVFTKSTESTTRLVQLFNFFEQSLSSKPLVMRSFSSELPLAERKAILDQFKAQEIQILVCSDLVSRGIDISHVSHVVSYDAPVDIRKYVHRVGRTARAGRAGIAWTLVEEQEARYFKSMLKDAQHLDRVKRLRANEKDLQNLTSHYEVALLKLKEVYQRNP